MFSGSTFAAVSGDDYGTTPVMPASYQKAVKIIKSGKYQEAIALLKLADSIKSKNTDINSLFVFSHRKIGGADKAGAYHRRALKTDVKHKGALEYRGELFLIVDNKAAAENNLRKLNKICWLGCSELDDLQTAIKNFKSQLATLNL